ncbi:endo-1,4-beta-xylanase [Cellulomonas alba]|uniref:Beta-xylanase n=1 Tax=Cellulomonas alba TaxID=3053467 RepID=A0ABT7SF23_9CELL|nr:endo-1,4-beta-xylanase [Cellulomonas alba]MDM7854129.1 endo-1,4-beta-xylanase [Cellulomonas alba]
MTPSARAVLPAALDGSFAHRRASTTLTVVDAAGAPVPGADVTVEQVRHEFGFGNIGFDLIAFANGAASGGHNVFGGARAEQGARLAELWLGLFDSATLPFYWRGFEREEGRTQTDVMMCAARWFADRGVRVKGHPLVWHTLAPQWLLGRSDAEVEAAIRARIRRDVTAFAGVIDLWDAINEVVIMPVFEAEENAVTPLAAARGRVAMVRMAFETAREANPGARLVLNDFDLSADYEHLIEECLAAGIVIDALGLQTHMHQGYRGEEQVAGILERFARFGLPLQLTETTLVSGELMPPEIVDLNDYVVDSWPSTPEGEARQADELLRHVRSLFGHPAVESMTYWGLSDDGAWLGAPAGLVRADGTTKPSYDQLRGLVRGDWWLAPTALTADEHGQVEITAFAGRYAVRAGGTAVEVDLAAGPGAVEVALAR